jgi:hypothetical protein
MAFEHIPETPLSVYRIEAARKKLEEAGILELDTREPGTGLVVDQLLGDGAEIISINFGIVKLRKAEAAHV